jgi:hypothetical protein
VRRLAIADHRFLFALRCLLFAVRCSLLAVRCVLFAVPFSSSSAPLASFIFFFPSFLLFSFLPSAFLLRHFPVPLVAESKNPKKKGKIKGHVSAAWES